MSNVYSRGTAKIHANLTPMIDVTFLLIVFFVLVSQIVDVEHVDMNLPAPDDPASQRAGDEQRVVLNVIPGPSGRAAGYKLGTNRYDTNEAGLAALTDRLTQLYRANPAMHVNLRADRGTHYRSVQSAMQAIADAAARVTDDEVRPRINLAVERQR